MEYQLHPWFTELNQAKDNMKNILTAIALTSALLLTGAFILIQAPHKIPLLWRIPYTWIETLDSQPKAIEALNRLRKSCKTHYVVISAYRSPMKNKLAGGVKNSKHLEGIAFDVIVPMSNREAFYECAKKSGFTAYGWGNKAVHIDMGTRRWWTYGDDKKHKSGSRAAHR